MTVLLFVFFHFISHSNNYEKKDQTAIQTNRTIPSHQHSLNTERTFDVGGPGGSMS